MNYESKPSRELPAAAAGGTPPKPPRNDRFAYASPPKLPPLPPRHSFESSDPRLDTLWSERESAIRSAEIKANWNAEMDRVQKIGEAAAKASRDAFMDRYTSSPEYLNRQEAMRIYSAARELVNTDLNEKTKNRNVLDDDSRKAWQESLNRYGALHSRQDLFRLASDGKVEDVTDIIRAIIGDEAMQSLMVSPEDSGERSEPEDEITESVP